MKKHGIKILLGIAVAGLVCGLAACGAGAKEKTLEEFLADPHNQFVLDDVQQMLVGTKELKGSITLEPKGDTLTYTYQTAAQGEISEEQKSVLQRVLEINAKGYANIAAYLDEYLGRPDACTFACRFIDANGSVVAEGSYKAADVKTLENTISDEAWEALGEYLRAETEGLDLDVMVKVNGDIIYYMFQLLETPDDLEAKAAQIQKALDASETIEKLALLAREFDIALGEVQKCAFVLQYLDPDGNVIAQGLYSAADRKNFEELLDSDPEIRARIEEVLAEIFNEEVSVSISAEDNIAIISATVPINCTGQDIEPIQEKLEAQEMTDLFSALALRFSEMIDTGSEVLIQLEVYDAVGNAIGLGQYSLFE